MTHAEMWLLIGLDATLKVAESAALLAFFRASRFVGVEPPPNPWTHDILTRYYALAMGPEPEHKTP